MRKTNIYEVAGHRFAVTAETSLLQEMEEKYGPFLVKDQDTSNLVFWMKVIEEHEFPPIDDITEEILQEGESIKMQISHVGDNPYFKIWLDDHYEGQLMVNANYQEAILSTRDHALFITDYAAKLIYTLRTAQMRTVLFHSSVVEHLGRAYMFLGKSGTGKSTHSRLWLKYIERTQLVNDDHPVVRITKKGTAIVYGSPWSGKTPCYRNVNYPIGGIVKLEQAPENQIRRLEGVEAYAAIVPSISGKRWDKNMADGLHETENALAMSVPVWHLRCLPDRAAAELCYEKVKE